MKKWLWLGLFLVGIWFALTNFQGLANQGKYDSIIINFREDVPLPTLTAQMEAIAQKYHHPMQLNSLFSVEDRLYTFPGDAKLLKALRQSSLKPLVEYIEPNYRYQVFKAPNDPDYSKQWNLRSINVEQAWDITQGQGVTVAVIDTGVSRVPDFKETKFVDGYDFVSDRNDASDDNGHGTHVAGTIAQSTNNGYGVAGIAYKAKIMPLKVLASEGGGTVADIAEAIRFAADKGADVINLSLGGGGESTTLKDAIDYAHGKGVVIVAAAGNANQNAAAYPARYPNVISVAALDAAGKKAPYSNFGAGVDIAAPGGSDEGKILQETIDPKEKVAKFEGAQGTSMAAPHVAGVAALLKASGIKDPTEILNVLEASARKVQDDPFNHFGSGQLDAGEAVKLAHQGKITFQDFFRWLRDNGYLNPRFWFDGGAVAVLPKVLMVLGSYVLAWLLRVYFPMQWSLPLNLGLVLGSSGFFFLRGFYIFDLPQAPFRVLGSSIPELGSIVQGSSALNPLTASVLIPFGLVLLLLGNAQWKWLAIGSALGVAACLTVNAFLSPAVMGLGNEAIAKSFLGVNALLCFGLAYLASKGEQKTV